MAPYACARLPSQQPPVLAGGESYPPNPKDTAMLKAYSRAVARINSVQNDEEGATAVEYALIVGLVSLIIIAALALIGPAVATFVTTDILPKL